MFVVVYIKSAEKYVVIPEKWVYNVNQELLKNKGVNRNRDILVFWSLNGLVDDKPNLEYPPNFHIEKSQEFPLPAGVREACYIARPIRYISKEKLYIKFKQKLLAYTRFEHFFSSH